MTGNAQTGSAPAGTRILGSLRAENGKGVVRMQDRFDTDIADLWSALTEPRRLALDRRGSGRRPASRR